MKICTRLNQDFNSIRILCTNGVHQSSSTSLTSVGKQNQQTSLSKRVCYLQTKTHMILNVELHFLKFKPGDQFLITNRTCSQMHQWDFTSLSHFINMNKNPECADVHLNSKSLWQTVSCVLMLKNAYVPHSLNSDPHQSRAATQPVRGCPDDKPRSKASQMAHNYCEISVCQLQIDALAQRK